MPGKVEEVVSPRNNIPPIYFTTWFGKSSRRRKDSLKKSCEASRNLYIQYKRGLSVCLVCLFVCSDLESKLLAGSQPNLAWATPWMGPVGNLEIRFWVDPPRGGIILEKLEKSDHSPYGPGQSAILLLHLLHN